MNKEIDPSLIVPDVELASSAERQEEAFLEEEEVKFFDQNFDEEAIKREKFLKDIASNYNGFLKYKKLWEDLKSSIQDRKERKKYAGKIFILISIWLIAVFALLIAQAIFGKTGEFSLPVPVLLTITGGTTASVVGIFVIVARYLFPDGNHHKFPSTKKTKKNPRKAKKEKK